MILIDYDMSELLSCLSDDSQVTNKIGFTFMQIISILW